MRFIIHIYQCGEDSDGNRDVIFIDSEYRRILEMKESVRRKLPLYLFFRTTQLWEPEKNSRRLTRHHRYFLEDEYRSGNGKRVAEG